MSAAAAMDVAVGSETLGPVVAASVATALAEVNAMAGSAVFSLDCVGLRSLIPNVIPAVKGIRSSSRIVGL